MSGYRFVRRAARTASRSRSSPRAPAAATPDATLRPHAPLGATLGSCARAGASPDGRPTRRRNLPRVTVDAEPQPASPLRRARRPGRRQRPARPAVVSSAAHRRHAELARAVAEHAYAAGASRVEVFYDDDRRPALGRAPRPRGGARTSRRGGAACASYGTATGQQAAFVRLTGSPDPRSSTASIPREARASSSPDLRRAANGRRRRLGRRRLDHRRRARTRAGPSRSSASRRRAALGGGRRSRMRLDEDDRRRDLVGALRAAQRPRAGR